MRKWQLKFHANPKISTRKFYPIKITGIERRSKPPGIAVTVVHLSAEQEGRSHHFLFNLPVRISSRGARFFAAAGMEIALDTQFNPQSIIGKSILVRFTENDAGDYVPAEFQGIEPGRTDEQGNKGGA